MGNIPQPAAPKPKLRWYQFSLRSLLILVTLFAFACSWFTVKMQQAKRQRETIEAIRKLGGLVIYGYTFDDAAPMVMTTRDAPAWLRQLLGKDFFDTASQVELRECKDADAALTLVKELPHVRNLQAFYTQVSDAGLSNLGGLTQLTYLNLSNTKVGDAGVKHLESLRELRYLSLANTAVSDEGMKSIATFTELEKLILSRTRVSDAGVERLKGLKKLRLLALDETQITDNSAPIIAGLPGLESLLLSDTKLTDASMVQLKSLLPQLTAFDVAGTAMSDASIDSFKDLSKLELLGIGRQVTDAGLERLSKLVKPSFLNLTGAQITDDGLESLERWTQLETLYLSQSRISDAGLVHLKTMKKLSLLLIFDTKITSHGINDLNNSLPNVKIIN